jgi:hypothetical protein
VASGGDYFFEGDLVGVSGGSNQSRAVPNGLVRALAVARERTAEQAKAIGLRVTEPPAPDAHQSPSAAALDLLRSNGVLAGAAEQDRLSILDGLAPRARSAVTGVLDAFAAFQSANNRAYADIDMGELTEAVAQIEVPRTDAGPVDPGAVLRNARLDLGPVLSARNLLLDAVSRLSLSWSSPAAVSESDPSDEGPAVQAVGGPPGISVPPVLAIDPAGEDNLYTESYLFVLDVGGNDVYQNNAGGGVGTNSLIDLAGTDEYGDRDGPGQDSGKNGGGYYGSGLLIDAKGDDVYTAGRYATNGGAGGGTGLLVDGAGSDIYSAGNDFTNGGAGSGVGGLVDASGDDTYVAGDTGTNGGGSTGGSGSLTDLSGDDSYTSYAPPGTDVQLTDGVALPGTNGVNGAGILGVGRLYDGCGNDEYLDGDGGTGTDKTVVPKGILGAQIDSTEACALEAEPTTTTPEPEPTTTTTEPEPTTTTTEPEATTTTTTEPEPTTTTTTEPEATTTTTTEPEATTTTTSTTSSSTSTTTSTTAASDAAMPDRASDDGGSISATRSPSSTTGPKSSGAGPVTAVLATELGRPAMAPPAIVNGRGVLARTGLNLGLASIAGVAAVGGGFALLSTGWARKRRR